MGRRFNNPWRQYCLPLALILGLGIVLRFTHLGQKVFWLDECFTALHLSGYSDDEVRQQAVNGTVIQNQDFLRFQRPGHSDLSHTVQRIALTAPELPPLYFTLAREWQLAFGDSVAVLRSFSAVVSLLTFPCIYWLCWELWRSPVTGWLAIALVAVSPFHLITAQEARPYSLLAVIVLATHGALLRARRVQTTAGWAIYAGLLALGLYTHLLFAAVLMAHGLYIGLSTRWQWRLLRSYLTTTCVGIALFLPWVIFALKHIPDSQIELPANRPEGATLILFWVKGWARGLSLVFMDFNLNDRSPKLALALFSVGVVLLLGLVAYSLYRLWCNEPMDVWLFLGCAVVVPALALLLPNVLTGGVQSVTARYWWPAYLGVQLVVARLFGTLAAIRQSKAKVLWCAGLVALLTVSSFSCIAFTVSPTWWSKANGQLIRWDAEQINAALQPLVVSDAFFVEIFPLSHLLHSGVTLQLFVAPQILPIEGRGKTVFLYRPSVSLLQTVRSMAPQVLSKDLWRLETPVDRDNT